MNTIPLQPGQNHPLPDPRLEIHLDVGSAGAALSQIRWGAMLLDRQRRAQHAAAFLGDAANGHGQSGVAVVRDTVAGMIRIDLAAVPADVVAIDLVAAIREGLGRGVTFSVLGPIRLRLTAGATTLEFTLPPAEVGETALILGQCYRHHEQWKFRALGQGFAQGLNALGAHYGLTLRDPDPLPAAPPQPSPRPSPGSPGGPAGGGLASGTGFCVHPEGYVVTNAHVIAEATAILGRSPHQRFALIPVFADPVNDLALLRAEAPLPRTGIFRGGAPARLGEGVVAVGYPLGGILGSGPQVTTGNLSALIGMHDDTRILQFTAPIQSGNSGGPLFDAWGRIIGVAMAKLDAARIHALTGDVPQNVNFALKGVLVMNFLEAVGIAYAREPVGERCDPADIAAAAREFVLRIECQV